MKFDARRNFLLALLRRGCGRRLPVFALFERAEASAGRPGRAAGQSTRRPDESHASQWEAGRAIYVGQCVGCHKPKPIQDFAIDEWKDKIVPGMSVKAKLAPEQTQSLVEYVMAVKRFQLVGSGHAKPRPLTTPISAADNR